MQNGGTLLGLGSASETAQQLLNLPIARVATVQPFSIGGSLLRETFDTSQPAAWGLPSDWVTYFNGDRAFNVSGNAKVVGAYPGTGNMLASGYEVGAEQLRGKADVVSMDVGQGWVTVVGSQSTFRSWPRSLWPLVSNSVYHGPSKAVTGPELKAAAAAAWAKENPGAEVPEPPETPERPEPTVSDAGRQGRGRSQRPRSRRRRRRRRRALSPSARRPRSPSPASWPRASAR